MKPNDLKNIALTKINELVQQKERLYLIGAILATVLLSLWIFQKPQDNTDRQQEAQELSMTIPKGYLVVPIELNNGKRLDPLISRMGIIDVFENKEKRLLAKNLRIIKLSQGETSEFGALVPEEKAGQWQDIFSDHGLSGALKSSTTDATQFYSRAKKFNSTTTYNTEDIL